jgi:hypothetical protein
MTETQQYYNQVETIALAGLNAEQSTDATPYIRTLVDDWLNQADDNSPLDAKDLVRIGLSDLERDIAGKTGEERLATLQSLAYEPIVQRTAGQALELAKQVADGTVSRQSVAPEAEQLHARIQTLIQEVKSFKDETNRRLLMRNLTDGDLEIRYVLEEEEGAISIRLNRYINS